MCSRKLVLSERAALDLRSILRYTKQSWGEPQAVAYLRRLEQAIEHITRFPLMGLSRQDLGDGVRLYAVEHHVVLYQVTDTQAVVLRLLHKRMNLSLQGGDEGGG